MESVEETTVEKKKTSAEKFLESHPNTWNLQDSEDERLSTALTGDETMLERIKQTTIDKNMRSPYSSKLSLEGNSNCPDDVEIVEGPVNFCLCESNVNHPVLTMVSCVKCKKLFHCACCGMLKAPKRFQCLKCEGADTTDIITYRLR